jgi:hypothetical protein
MEAPSKNLPASVLGGDYSPSITDASDPFPIEHQRNNRLVWQAATRVVEELMDDVWDNKREVHAENTLVITIQAC